MGSHTRNKSQRRTERILLRVTLDERRRMLSAARKAGLTVSAYIRKSALKERLLIRKVEAIDPALIAELNRIGVNLNQMTRAANRGRFVPPDAVEVLCEQIEQILREGLDL